MQIETDITRRTPPESSLYDPDCEIAVLGALLKQPTALDNHELYQNNPLTVDDFCSKKHKAIFAHWQLIKNETADFNITLFASKADDNGTLNDMGGLIYLKKVITKETTVLSTLYSLIESLQDKTTRRKLIQTAEDILNSATSPAGKSADTLVMEASAHIDTVFNSINTQSSARGFTEALVTELTELQESFANPEKAKSRYVPTGFSVLDTMLNGGLRRGSLNVIAARPGMGKTALGVNILTNISMNQNISMPTLFFSLEMKSGEIAQRQMTSFAQISIPELENNKLSNSDWIKILSNQKKMLRTAPNGEKYDMLIIDDHSTLTPSRLKTSIKKTIRAYGGVSAVLIDYVQLMESEQSFEYKHQELSDISKKLKAIANEFNIPIILLAQLNKSVDSRANKRPISSDIGECDKIVHTADTIMLLHREEMYNPTDENSGKATLILSKNRSGRSGDIPLNYVGQFFTFSDIYQHQHNSSVYTDRVWA